MPTYRGVRSPTGVDQQRVEKAERILSSINTPQHLSAKDEKETYSYEPIYPPLLGIVSSRAIDRGTVQIGSAGSPKSHSGQKCFSPQSKPARPRSSPQTKCRPVSSQMVLEVEDMLLGTGLSTTKTTGNNGIDDTTTSPTLGSHRQQHRCPESRRDILNIMAILDSMMSEAASLSGESTSAIMASYNFGLQTSMTSAIAAAAAAAMNMTTTTSNDISSPTRRSFNSSFDHGGTAATATTTASHKLSHEGFAEEDTILTDLTQICVKKAQRVRNQYRSFVNHVKEDCEKNVRNYRDQLKEAIRALRRSEQKRYTLALRLDEMKSNSSKSSVEEALRVATTQPIYTKKLDTEPKMSENIFLLVQETLDDEDDKGNEEILKAAEKASPFVAAQNKKLKFLLRKLSQQLLVEREFCQSIVLEKEDRIREHELQVQKAKIQMDED